MAEKIKIMLVEMRRNLANLSVKIILDLGCFVLSLSLSHILRFSYKDAFTAISDLGIVVPILLATRIVLNYVFNLYTNFWRYTNIYDLQRVIISTSAGSLGLVVMNFTFGHLGISRLIVTMDWLLVIFLAGGVRLVARKVYESSIRQKKHSEQTKNVLIYGAGRAGELLLRNIKNTRDSGIKVIGLVDDDPLKHGRNVHGMKILGSGREIERLAREYNISEIYFAIASLSGLETRQILNLIKEQVGSQIEVKTIPGLKSLVDGRVSVNALRSIELKDLLKRKPVTLDYSSVQMMIEDSNVLVVGGGGSIGSELCRQIAQYKPRRLSIVDNSELNLYTIEDTLAQVYPGLKIDCFVADAANEMLMRRIFLDHQFDLVFHAAAYKHVPLMEANPWAAVQNNLECTRVLCELSDEYKIDKFVLISSDKAVNPTSVMGATKRICEYIILNFAARSDTKFMSVRFGNVLGSSGSVIPKFRRQIENGGPITVTHPDITRFFMLISEAVELVLQAGSIGISGNIYVLDMGSPIRIVDLARYMVELSGLELNADIKIEYIGLRPGEKMHESLYLEGEECDTHIPGLMVLTPNMKPDDNFMQEIMKFSNECMTMKENAVRKKLKYFVPTYEDNGKDAKKEAKILN